MVAETLTGTRAATALPAQGWGHGNSIVPVWGKYSVAANVEDGDIFEMCRTPDGGSGFLLLGGYLAATDMDTNATETLDMDLGWAANGTAAQATITLPDGDEYSDSGYSASATGLINSDVLIGDAITNLTAAGINYRPIVLTAGPLWFAKPTKIQVEANAAAATFAAGTMFVMLYGQVL